MYLVVSELTTTIYQEILVGSRDIQLVAIRPHLMKFKTATGSLNLSIYDVNGNKISSSESIAISAISAANYWHGYQRFYISTQLKSATKYRIQLESTGGYSFSESAYIGWCGDYDLRKVPALYSPNGGTAGALDMEFWEYADVWRRTG